MRKIHNFMAFFIFLTAFLFSYLADLKISTTTSLQMITFFSVVFGFYVTAIAILYSASYTKTLHHKIDEKQQKRGIHILRDYLLIIGRWAIISTSSIIVFTILATKKPNDDLVLIGNSTKYSLVFCIIDTNLAITSTLFGIAAVNVFFMLLLLHTIIDGLVEESKNNKN